MFGLPATDGVDGESATAFVEPETELEVLEDAVAAAVVEPAEEMIADASAGLIVAVLMVADAEPEELPLLAEPPLRAS